MFNEDVNDLEDFFSSGDFPPTFRFDQLGARITGIIAAEPVVRQQIDIMTKKPKCYDDGNPMKQVIICLQTEWYNWEGVGSHKIPDGESDDGRRTVYCKGQMLTALKKAMKDAGVKGAPKVGATLGVMHASNRDTGKPQPLKVYECRYSAPTAETLAKVSTAVPSPFDEADPWATPSSAAAAARSSSTLDSMRRMGNTDNAVPF